jgi:hypothetical protein
MRATQEALGSQRTATPRACYLVLTADGSSLDIEFQRVEYDVGHEAQSIENAEMPNAFADMLRTGTS